MKNQIEYIMKDDKYYQNEIKKLNIYKIQSLLRWLLMIGLLLAFVFVAKANLRDTIQTECYPIYTPEEEEMTGVYEDYEIACWLVKSFENLTLESKFDHKQYSIGYGTKSFKGEKITRYKANKRFKEDFNFRYKKLEKLYPNLTRWQRLVLTSAAYNLGSFKGNLHKAILSGDNKKISEQLIKYVHASGVKKDGLVKRRKLEIKLLNADHHLKQHIGSELAKKVIKINSKVK